MDTQATFFATMIDEWARCGIQDAVISPGSRSTLLAAMIESDPRIRTHVMVDERSAAFFALGIAQVTGRPTLIWTSTGTASVEVHAAVVEAHHARVPLLVCTADRPPELHHSRDWQSTPQTGIYASSTRWSFDPGVATIDMSRHWRSIAARSVAETMHHPSGPGPVHLNLPIREPWAYEIGDLPAGRDGGRPWHRHHRPVTLPSPDVVKELALGGRRGVIVAGKGGYDVDALHACAAALGWPVLADFRSRARLPLPNTVGTMDALLRSERFRSRQKPDVVLRLGTPPLSRFTPVWVAEAGAEEWLVDPIDNWEGSVPHAANIVQADPTELLRAVSRAATGERVAGWLESWQHAEQLALATIEAGIPRDSLNEPAIARALVDNLPDGANLFASTSMPVRDIEWYGKPRGGLSVYANRGVSGMDGLISTAAGIASASRQPTVMLVGDLSFLYDLNALWATKGATEQIDLTIVVMDNNGGGIFSILPYFSAIDPAVFERVLGTPQDVDIPSIAEALGVKVETIRTLDELMPAVHSALDAGGMRVVYARTIDRATNAALHKQIHANVAAAIDAE